jgi:hypothetical protein
MMGFERSSVLMVLFIETSPRGEELEGQHDGGRPKKRWRLEPRKGMTAREVGR